MEIKDFKLSVLSSKNKLFRFAFRLLQNHEEAEDTVQDVFLKLWDMRHKLDQYNSVEALAMTMTKNKCLDKLKSKRNNNVDIEQQVAMRSGFTAPDRKTELRDTSGLIQKAINQLPEQQRMIIQNVPVKKDIVFEKDSDNIEYIDYDYFACTCEDEDEEFFNRLIDIFQCMNNCFKGSSHDI